MKRIAKLLVAVLILSNIPVTGGGQPVYAQSIERGFFDEQDVIKVNDTLDDDNISSENDDDKEEIDETEKTEEIKETEESENSDEEYTEEEETQEKDIDNQEQKMAAFGLLDNSTVLDDGQIKTEADLLTLLNSGTSTNTDVKFVLYRDMYIEASELDETNFTKFNLVSDFDGGGNTIYIDVDTPDKLARTLFYSIGSNHLNNGQWIIMDLLKFNDLNIVYNGDVNVSAFAQQYVEHVDIDNVHIIVNGDIVANYAPVPNLFANMGTAFGFAYGVGDNGQDLLSTMSVSNVSITANTIGSTDRTTTPYIRSVSGFGDVVGGAYSSPGVNFDGLNLSNITLNYGEMRADSQIALVMSGFAQCLRTITGNELRENININIAGDMYASGSQKQFQSYGDIFHTIGIHGFSGNLSKLKNSTIHVGGDITYDFIDGSSLSGSGIVDEHKKSLWISGIGAVNDIGVGSVEFENVKVIIDGDITANGYQNVLFSGAVNQLNNHKSGTAKNNSVQIGGSVALNSVWGGSVVGTGFMYEPTNSSLTHLIPALSSEGNSVYIEGNFEATNPGTETSHTTFLAGHSIDVVNSKNDSVFIGGNLISTNNNRSSYVSGFSTVTFSGDVAIDHKNNSVTILKDIQTYSGGASGFISGYIEATKNATIENCTVRIGGSIISEGASANNPGALSAGFARILRGDISNCGVYVRKDIISLNSVGTPNAVGFALQVSTDGKVDDCVVRVDGSITSGENASAFAVNGLGSIKNATAYAANISGTANPFVLFADDNSIIKGNTLIGTPYNGDNAIYSGFVPTVSALSDVAGNYYTAMLDGQRASNLLTYDAVNNEFIIDSADSPGISSIEVSAATDFTGGEKYIEDVRNESVCLIGGVAGSTLAVDKITANHEVPLSVLRASSGAALDIIGLGYIYEGSVISGKVTENTASGNPLGNVKIEVLDSLNKVVASGVTDGTGVYSIKTPLYCTNELGYTLRMNKLPGYLINAGNTDNDFNLIGAAGAYGDKTLSTVPYFTDTTTNGVQEKDPDAVFFTLTYDGNGNTGGTVPAGVQSYLSGSEVSVLGNTGNFVKTNAVFLGWARTQNAVTPEFIGGGTFNITEDTILYAVWEDDGTNPVDPDTLTVTYLGNGNTSGSVPVDTSQYKNGDLVTVLGNTGNLVKTDATFLGWSVNSNASTAQYTGGDTFTISENTTLYAVWKADGGSTGGGGGGGTGSNKVTVTFLWNDGRSDDVYEVQQLTSGEKASKPKNPVKEGYMFLGWYTEAECINLYDFNLQVTSNKKLYAGWEPVELLPFSDDHYAYLVGDDKGLIRPEANITRGETVAILFRLITEEYRDQIWTKSNGYPDVNLADWYNTGISTMSNGGIVKGYPDGTFKPNGFITRAELATIVAQFTRHSYQGADLFDDINGHWAAQYINIAADLGWISGDGDGKYRPDDYITRAETTTLVNQVLGRKPGDINALLSEMIVWPDNMDTSKWYYLAMQEATNSHDYELDEATGFEVWTALIENYDWRLLER